MNMVEAFARNAATKPNNPALFVEGRLYTYGDLAVQASKIAGWLRDNVPEGTPRVGVWADRTLAAYAGILGILWAGATYVPLSPKFPEARLAEIIKQAELSALIVSDSQAPVFDEVIFPLLPLAILIHDGEENGEMSDCCTRLENPVPVESESYCYLMFTSGTTGKPKGIPVTLGNVMHFIETMQSRYQFGPDDRFSQYSELTFDLSVFDMFMAWQAGATLYVVPVDQFFTPASFICEHKLTVWFSVPSLIGLLSKMKLLKHGSLTSLRFSLFCGEPFVRADANAWLLAAPNSVVENIYGPTEVTVGCAVQPFTVDGDITSERGTLAIGKPFPGMKFAIIDGGGNFLADSQRGELVIAGPQVTPGYWHNPELTKQRYVRLEHPSQDEETWYFTGDESYRDSAGVYHFLGRLDNQVKIGGYRVELEEIEFYIREVTGCSDVVSMVLTDNISKQQILVAAIGKKDFEQIQIKSLLRRRLPEYMVPHRLVRLDNWPRNPSGKIDRKEVRILLEEL